MFACGDGWTSAPSNLCIGGIDKKGCVNGPLLGSAKYDKRCVRCFCAAFPNDDRSKLAQHFFQAKEHAVREELEKAFPSCKWTFDRRFCTGVSKRPDAKVTAGNRILIVEIDEFSHRMYPCGKEREREELFNKYAGENVTVVMLRFNPDDYTCVATGKRVPSCFRQSAQGARVTVDPKQQTQWRKRIDTLKWRISVFIDNDSEDYMEVIPEPPAGRCIYMEELFYDDVERLTPADKEKMIAYFKRCANARADAKAAAELAAVAQGV